MESVSKNEMKPLTKVVSDWVHEYFKKHDLDITEEGNRATYQFTGEVSGDFNFRGYVEVYEERPGIEVYLYAPGTVPERRRSEVAELLARINYGLVMGSIGLDLEDGTLRFKDAIDVKDGILSITMVNALVDRGMAILDDFLPAVMAVTHANVLPKDAYAEVTEGKKRKKPEIPPEEDLSDAPPWERFLGSDPLRAWANELQVAIENKADKDAWSLIGRNAVLINSDENYCRDVLRRVAADSGMRFIHIPASEVMSMPPASAFRSMAPVLVYLEHGRWMLDKGGEENDNEDAERVTKFHSSFSEWLREFNPAKPVVFAVSAIKLDDVAERLRQVGLFDRFMTLPDQSMGSMGQDFIEEIGRDSCGPSMLESPGKVGQLIRWNFNKIEQRELAVLTLKRLQSRHKRPIEFLDLVHISTHDLIEEGIPRSVQEEVRRQTAYHEAGHSVIRVLETAGQDIPDYTSIVPGASGFAGVSVLSYGFSYAKGDEQTTYQDLRQSVRISLAGRAGEELAVGVENVSAGACSDLEKATSFSCDAFAYWGFSPSMDQPGRSESNLAVIIGKPTSSEYAHIESLSREFLATEYQIVLEKLAANRALLDEVAERLMWDPIVDQKELAEICSKHGATVCI